MLLKTNGSIKKSERKSENTLRKIKINTTFANLRDAAKAVLSWKFIVIQAYLKEQQQKYANKNLTYCTI